VLGCDSCSDVASLCWLGLSVCGRGWDMSETPIARSAWAEIAKYRKGAASPSARVTGDSLSLACLCVAVSRAEMFWQIKSAAQRATASSGCV